MTKPSNIDFFVISVHHGKSGHILKPPVTKFRSDLSVRSRDNAEKQVPAKLTPMVVVRPVKSENFNQGFGLLDSFQFLRPLMAT